MVQLAIWIKFLLSLGANMCQQLIGWKNEIIYIYIYILLFMLFKIVNIINKSNNVAQVFGSIWNNKINKNND